MKVRNARTREEDEENGRDEKSKDRQIDELDTVTPRISITRSRDAADHCQCEATRDLGKKPPRFAETQAAKAFSTHRWIN